MKGVPGSVDEYILGFPSETNAMLDQLRETIRKAAPDADESISYAIPSYKLSGMLVSFAGYARHIGFYPGAGGITEFMDELSSYKSAKGSVQFPLDGPLQLRLIARIVKFRVKQNIEKTKNK